MMELIGYLKTHGGALITLSYLIVVLLEVITSLTPTKKDDSFAERVGKFHRKMLDFMRVPNMKREDGSIVIPKKVGTHPKREDGGTKE